MIEQHLGALILCAGLITACDSGMHTAVAQEIWPAEVCLPYTGPNPSLDDARLAFREAVVGLGPAGKGETVEDLPADLLDDSTRSERLHAPPGSELESASGHDARYAELAPGAVAYVSQKMCEGHEPGMIWMNDSQAWGPRAALGYAIATAVSVCDTLKGGASNDTFPEGFGPYGIDGTRVCPQYGG